MSVVDPQWDVRARYMESTIAREMFDVICGQHLGNGIARSVYVYALNPAYVVKFEVAAQSFQNAMEWDAWENTGAKWRQWLAQCREISPCGSVLIQRRAEPIPKNFRWPKVMPAFLCDYQAENYGLVDGRLVCFDYGINNQTHETFKKDGARMVSTKKLRAALEPWLR